MIFAWHRTSVHQCNGKRRHNIFIYIYISNGLCLSTLPQRVLNTHMSGWLLWLLNKVRTQVICTTMAKYNIKCTYKFHKCILYCNRSFWLIVVCFYGFQCNSSAVCESLKGFFVIYRLPDDWYYPWNHGRTYDLSSDFFQQSYIHIYKIKQHGKCSS